MAGVTAVHSPIACARRVMTHSPHVLLAGRGADEFCAAEGLPQEPPSYFRTERRWAQLQMLVNGTGLRRAQERPEAVPEEVEWGDLSEGSDALMFDLGKYGTVGAVARDRRGHLAAGTSTGAAHAGDT